MPSAGTDDPRGGADDPTGPAGDRRDPEVTVVVVSYFSADTLPACLTSVLDQRGVVPEVIVVDNAEVDGKTETEQLCREYGRVRYVDNDDNVGFGSAVNLGFERAETDLLATVNPDAEIGPDCLARLADPLLEGDAAFTVPKVRKPNERDRIRTCGLWNHFTGVSFRQGNGLPAGDPRWTRGQEVGLEGSVFATTAEAWELTGGFDDELFMYKDDVTVSWACSMLGLSVRLVPGARAWHDDSLELDGWKFHNVERGRMLLLAKYFPPSALLLVPSLLLAELLTWVMAATVGPGALAGKLRAYAALVSEDGRSIRSEHRDFQRRFPERIDDLHAEIPWSELANTGIVPDSSVLRGAGAAVNLVFRLNLWLYLAVVERK